MSAVNPRPLAPVPVFPERGRQVYEAKIAQNVARGRSDGRMVDPVLACEPDDSAFGDESVADQAGR
jgi:hypothetical protein